MADATVPFTVTAISDDERTECIVCLADFMQQTDADERIWQCSDGHTLCAGCFARVGGCTALCSVCAVPIGSIRNRALEKLRNAHLARQKARAVPCGARDGGGAQDGGAQRGGGNFTFYPAQFHPLDGGGSGPSTLAAASGGEPAKPAARFAFVPPAPARPLDDAAAGGGLHRACSVPGVASTAAPAAESDVASTTSTLATEASPTSNLSSAEHSTSPEGAAGAASGSNCEQHHSPVFSGTRSASASPMDVDASASKSGPARRASSRVFLANARDKAKWRAKKEAGGKDKEVSAGGEGFVFEVSEMLKRTVLEPTSPEPGEQRKTQQEQAGRECPPNQCPPNQFQQDGFKFQTPFKTGPCLFAQLSSEAGSGQGCATYAGSQTHGLGPLPHASAAAAHVHASDADSGFLGRQPSFGSPVPKPVSARKQHKSDKKGRGGAAPAPESRGFCFAAPNLPTSPSKTGSAGEAASEAAPFNPDSRTFSFSPPTGARASEDTGHTPFVFDPKGPGGFNFNVPSHPAASADQSFCASASTNSASASPPARHSHASHARAGSSRRSSRGTPGKKGTSKPSPSYRPENDEDEGQQGGGGFFTGTGLVPPKGGGFNFRTPLKTQVPAELQWQDPAERDAFEKLARIAGAAAATRLLVRNPNTPPSKLLSRVTIAEQRLPRQEGFSQGRQDRVAEEQVEADAGNRKFGDEPQTAGAIRERCMQLKDRCVRVRVRVRARVHAHVRVRMCVFTYIMHVYIKGQLALPGAQVGSSHRYLRAGRGTGLRAASDQLRRGQRGCGGCGRRAPRCGTRGIGLVQQRRKCAGEARARLRGSRVLPLRAPLEPRQWQGKAFSQVLRTVTCIGNILGY
jgi:hypothetical protein